MDNQGCRAGWGCLGNSELPTLGVHTLPLPQHSKWLRAWVIFHPLLVVSIHGKLRAHLVGGHEPVPQGPLDHY